MKPHDDPLYQREFPENYNWHCLDSQHLSIVASYVAKAIKRNIKTQDRNNVPGLRQALNIIAEYANIV